MRRYIFYIYFCAVICLSNLASVDVCMLVYVRMCAYRKTGPNCPTWGELCAAGKQRARRCGVADRPDQGTHFDIPQCAELMSLFIPYARNGAISEGQRRHYHPHHYFGRDYHYSAIVTTFLFIAAAVSLLSRRPIPDGPFRRFAARFPSLADYTELVSRRD